MKIIKRFSYLLLLLSILNACQNDDLDTDQDDLLGINFESKVPMAFPGETGEIVTMYYKGQEIVLEKIHDTYVLDGDIIFTSDQLTEKPINNEITFGAGVSNTQNLWPNNTVYYDIESSLPNQSRVFDAIANWEQNTSLTFVRRTNQSNYVYFRRGAGCSAQLGMIGGRQVVTLADACETSTTIHEIGHAVGLYHEHRRSDRDNFVTVNFGNVENGRASAFERYVDVGQQGRDYTSFDFNSVMLYHSYSFSANGQPTIVRKDGSVYASTNNGLANTVLSQKDIEGINQMYPSTSSGGDDNNGICSGVSEWQSGVNYKPGDRVVFQGKLNELNAAGTAWDIIGDCSEATEDTSNNDICAGLSEWQSNANYRTGDRVTYQGSLFERTSSGGWNNLGECGEAIEDTSSNDICAGFSEWQSSASYRTGDRVTYQGSLFERTSSGGWNNLGACGE